MSNYSPPKELAITGTGPVRTVTLNRPDQRNAVNPDLHRGLARVWDGLRDDPEVRAVVLTGAGQAFCAGGDMDFLDRMTKDPSYRHHVMYEARAIVHSLTDFPLPVVAAVNGPAVGLGCSLAVLCDIVLVSEDAYLADPHVPLGLVAADGGVLAWPLMTSLLRAKEYLYTGDRIGPATAVELGLANRVVPAADLMTEAQALAERLAAQPAQALRDTKRALNMHLSQAIRNVIDFAFSAEAETFTLPELRHHLDRVNPR